jgi:hypothetical protein
VSGFAGEFLSGYGDEMGGWVGVVAGYSQDWRFFRGLAQACDETMQ